MQSRTLSAIEVASNYLVGFTLAWLVAYFLLPLWGWPVGVDDATEVTLLFTGISLIRSYLWRRLFNWIHMRRARC